MKLQRYFLTAYFTILTDSSVREDSNVIFYVIVISIIKITVPGFVQILSWPKVYTWNNLELNFGIEIYLSFYFKIN